jgi:sugar phosphate isomerase/epimerase
MIIGAMNHPSHDVLEEIRWMAEMGLQFLDLTLEPPAALSNLVNAREIRKSLEDHGFSVVGHTAYYLPFCSPFEALRKAAIEEMINCLKVFAEVGATCVNMHPDRHAPFHDRSFIIRKNIETIQELLPVARDCGITLMVENLPGDFNSVEQLGELLEPLPELALHLDLGHCNLQVNRTTADDLISVYGDRLKHVHLHDNKGGTADLHLPLGTGNINVRKHIRSLQDAGYDGPITLEVFSPNRDYLAQSMKLLKILWEQESTFLTSTPQTSAIG